MIRTRYIIPRADVFKYVDHPLVSKVELMNSRQSKLKNNELCSVYVYHRIDWSLCLAFIGNCSAMAKEISSFVSENPKFNIEHDVSFLFGLSALRSCGFISCSHVAKVLAMEQMIGRSFKVPHEIKRICALTPKWIHEA